MSTAIRNPIFPGNIYYKLGNFNTALEDLTAFFAQPTDRPVQERVPGRLFIVQLDENITIVARSFSSFGSATIAIQDKTSGTSIALAKVRYTTLIPVPQ